MNQSSGGMKNKAKKELEAAPKALTMKPFEDYEFSVQVGNPVSLMLKHRKSLLGRGQTFARGIRTRYFLVQRWTGSQKMMHTDRIVGTLFLTTDKTKRNTTVIEIP